MLRLTSFISATTLFRLALSGIMSWWASLNPILSPQDSKCSSLRLGIANLSCRELSSSQSCLVGSEFVKNLFSADSTKSKVVQMTIE